MPVFPAEVLPPGTVGSLVVPYGYEFRNFAFGAGTDFVCEEVDGLLGSADSRDEDLDKEHDHGVNPGVLLFGKRIIAFDMKVKGTQGADIETKLQTLNRIFQPPRVRHSKRTEPFVFQRPGMPKKVIYVRCTKRDFPSNYKTARGFAEGSVELQAPDPLIYSLEVRQSVLGLSTGIVTNAMVVEQIGDHADGAFPTIEITGPATNPIIENETDDGRAIRLEIVLAANDAVRINTKTKVAERRIGAGGTWTRHYAMIRDDNEWWRILPGLNTIRYNRTGSASPSSLTVSWQDTWN